MKLAIHEFGSSVGNSGSWGFVLGPEFLFDDLCRRNTFYSFSFRSQEFQLSLLLTLLPRKKKFVLLALFFQRSSGLKLFNISLHFRLFFFVPQQFRLLSELAKRSIKLMSWNHMTLSGLILVLAGGHFSINSLVIIAWTNHLNVLILSSSALRSIVARENWRGR